MDVRGQRILIFGDSLSHHGADAGPEIWDVDQGSARASGQPGDLLASMLLEQGAAAVRVNARVGRSAHNFFSRENFQALLDSDQAFMPTKVFVVLGTNDIGLTMSADEQAMRKIRDFYKGLGADVWAIGPFAYANDQLNQQALPVVEMMRGVFGGSRYIDPRSVTAMVGRARDGVHFGGDSARVTAEGLQKLVLSTAQPKTWLPFAIGIIGAVGGALAYSWWKKGGAQAMPFSGLGYAGLSSDHEPNTGSYHPELVAIARASSSTADFASRAVAWAKTQHDAPSNKELALAYWRASGGIDRLGTVMQALKKSAKGLGDAQLGERCSVSLSPAAFARCTKRQQRALGENDDPLAKRQRIGHKITALIQDPDPGALIVAEDLALENEIKLSELSKGGTDDRGTFWLNNDPDVIKRDRVSWRIKRVNERHGGECKAIFDVRIDGKRVGGEERESDHVKFEEHYQGNKDYCRRAATAQAWALVKETKKLRAKGFEPQAHDIFHALDRDNSEPEELFGLKGKAARDLTKSEAQDEFYRLLKEDDADALAIAEDLALQHELKLSEITMRDEDEGEFVLKDGDVSPTEDEEGRTSVVWQISAEDPRPEYADGQGRRWWEKSFSTFVNGNRVMWDQRYQPLDERPKHARSWWNSAHGKCFGTAEQCRRQAAADAWAITKALKPLAIVSHPESVEAPSWPPRTEGSIHDPVRHVIETVLDGKELTMTPPELFGLSRR